MWLITPIGFFSIVQKPGDKQNGTLTVRSRVRSDLAALKESYLPGLGPIQESHDTDYRFRAIAPRKEVSAAIARMVDGLDYSNFKTEVGKKQGQNRAGLYHQVWDVLYKLQTDPVFAVAKPTADSYGGVLISGGRKVLLREPTKHHGGYPLDVHLEFRDRVFKALQTRQKKGLGIDWNQWGNVLDIWVEQE